MARRQVRLSGQPAIVPLSLVVSPSLSRRGLAMGHHRPLLQPALALLSGSDRDHGDRRPLHGGDADRTSHSPHLTDDGRAVRESDAGTFAP